jgi:hypothetical protein
MDNIKVIASQAKSIDYRLLPASGACPPMQAEKESLFILLGKRVFVLQL